MNKATMRAPPKSPGCTASAANIPSRSARNSEPTRTRSSRRLPWSFRQNSLDGIRAVSAVGLDRTSVRSEGLRLGAIQNHLAGVAILNALSRNANLFFQQQTLLHRDHLFHHGNDGHVALLSYAGTRFQDLVHRNALYR